MSEIELGDLVKDVVTGFKGIVTVVSTYLHGEPSYGVEAVGVSEGKKANIPSWLSGGRLKIVEKNTLGN